jgi:long-chain fatty acid transport protein
MGNAFSAVADDPSTLFFNPAGLANLEHRQISIGVAPHFPNTEYSMPGGGEARESLRSIWVPNAYVGVPLVSDFSLGFGVNSPFGLETHWPDSTPFKYVATDSRLRVVEGHAGLGCEINPGLLVGFAVTVIRADARLSSALNVTGVNGAPSPDGGRTLSGDGVGLGGNFGILWSPQKEVQLALAYRTRAHVRLEGNLKLSGLSGLSASPFVFGGTEYQTPIETTLDLPESLTFGIALRPFDRWLFSADVERVGYNVVQKNSIDYASESSPTILTILNAGGNPIPRDWRTTWNFGAGVSCRATKRLDLMGGYFYYPHVIPNRTWDPSTPDASRHGVTAGVGIQAGPVRLDLAYNIIFFMTRDISNTVGNAIGGSVNGSYRSRPEILSINLSQTW